LKLYWNGEEEQSRKRGEGSSAEPRGRREWDGTALEYARKHEYRKVLPLLEKASSSKVKSGARAVRAKR
jgi:hypothetical protein